MCEALYLLVSEFYPALQKKKTCNIPKEALVNFVLCSILVHTFAGDYSLMFPFSRISFLLSFLARR